MKHKVKHIHFIAVNARNRDSIALGGSPLALLASPPMPRGSGTSDEA